MIIDRFSLALEGWKILEEAPESREAARRLLTWLTEALELYAASLSYRDASTGYGWEERVTRLDSSMPVKESSLERPLPCGRGRWILEGLPSGISLDSLLDLLASQWTRLMNPIGKGRRERRMIKVGREDSGIRPGGWIAVSRSSRILVSKISEWATMPRPLLLHGEPGSGREHLARTLHDEGPKPDADFRVWPGVTEYQSGTCYIPKWETLTQADQNKAMALECRLIASCSRLTESVKDRWLHLTQGRGGTLKVPSLKDRIEDLPLLAGRILEGLSAELRKEPLELSSTALEAMAAYTWPGNLRELKECLIEAAEKTDDRRIGIGDLPPAIRGALPKPASSCFPARLVALEYEALKEELSRQGGNMTRTAQALGLTPRQVSWRVRKYGIDPKDYKSTTRSR